MSGDPVESMWRTARRLAARRRGAPDRLPPMLFFTDPERTPSPEETLARLPPGAGIVFRSFGRPDWLQRGPALRRLARERGVLFFVGADAALARTLDSDGIHLPQRATRRVNRGAFPRGFLVTAAAHDLAAALAAQRYGVDAVLVSAVFPSSSPSAGAPIGVTRFASIVRAAGVPTYALGGVNSGTAMRLGYTGAAGFAAIEGFLPRAPSRT